MRKEERKKKNKENPNQSKASKRKPNGIKDKSRAGSLRTREIQILSLEDNQRRI
jgi:hypothetical protein